MNTRALLLPSIAGTLLLAQTPSNITFDRLLAANKEPQNWLTYSGTTMSQRYSLLTQITTANARNLEQAWTLKTQTGEKFEETPLVVDGVMYTVVPPPPRGGRGGGGGGRGGRGRGGAAAAPAAGANAAEAGLAAPTPAPAPAPLPAPAAPAVPATPPPPQTFDVVALNAATGATLWSYSYLPSTDAKPCCGRVNRGLAILGSTLYMGTTDAHLIAIDAKTGKLLWNTEVATAKEGYAITHAPLIVKDKVLIGTAGGEYGIRGFVAAYNAATGKEVWRFHNIPEPGEPGNETWAGDSWKHGAASVWTTGSYDPDLNLTYWGTVTGGGLAPDGRSWIAARERFFLPIQVLSALFRGKFLDALRQAYAAGHLKLAGSTTALSQPHAWRHFLDELYQKNWVVYAKPPFASPEFVFRYLGRYTHRVAISNQRILAVEEGKVTFTLKNYSAAARREQMTVDAVEFIRRFLLHVLPPAFTRIRHFGLYAGRNVQTKLLTARTVLAALPPAAPPPSASAVQTALSPSAPPPSASAVLAALPPAAPPPPVSAVLRLPPAVVPPPASPAAETDHRPWWQRILDRTGIDPLACPACRRGRLLPCGEVTPLPGNALVAPDASLRPHDTS